MDFPNPRCAIDESAQPQDGAALPTVCSDYTWSR